MSLTSAEINGHKRVPETYLDDDGHEYCERCKQRADNPRRSYARWHACPRPVELKDFSHIGSSFIREWRQRWSDSAERRWPWQLYSLTEQYLEGRGGGHPCPACSETVVWKGLRCLSWCSADEILLGLSRAVAESLDAKDAKTFRWLLDQRYRIRLRPGKAGRIEVTVHHEPTRERLSQQLGFNIYKDNRLALGRVESRLLWIVLYQGLGRDARKRIRRALGISRRPKILLGRGPNSRPVAQAPNPVFQVGPGGVGDQPKDQPKDQPDRTAERVLVTGVKADEDRAGSAHAGRGERGTDISSTTTEGRPSTKHTSSNDSLSPVSKRDHSSSISLPAGAEPNGPTPAPEGVPSTAATETTAPALRSATTKPPLLRKTHPLRRIERGRRDARKLMEQLPQSDLEPERVENALQKLFYPASASRDVMRVRKAGRARALQKLEAGSGDQALRRVVETVEEWDRLRLEHKWVPSWDGGLGDASAEAAEEWQHLRRSAYKPLESWDEGYFDLDQVIDVIIQIPNPREYVKKLFQGIDPHSLVAGTDLGTLLKIFPDLFHVRFGLDDCNYIGVAFSRGVSESNRRDDDDYEDADDILSRFPDGFFDSLFDDDEAHDETFSQEDRGVGMRKLRKLRVLGVNETEFDPEGDPCYGKHYNARDDICRSCTAPVLHEGKVVLFNELCAAASR